MDVKKYDIFIIGHVSLDENVYHDQAERIYGELCYMLCSCNWAEWGGILTKSPEDDEIASLFNIPRVIYHIKSGKLHL